MVDSPATLTAGERFVSVRAVAAAWAEPVLLV